MMHRRRWIIGIATVVTISGISSISAGATASIFFFPLAGQEPAATPQSKPGSPESSSTTKGKHSHANDVLIRGTVFNEHGLSLAGVRLQIQRADAKKPRWETRTNFRGEFAVRVPPGADYRIAAEIKGFAKQSQVVNGKDGAAEEKVIFHMEPVKREKEGKP